MISMQYGKALIAKDIGVGDIYDKVTLCDTFFEVMTNPSITAFSDTGRQPHTDLTSLALLMRSFLTLKIESSKENHEAGSSSPQIYQQRRPREKSIVEVVD